MVDIYEGTRISGCYVPLFLDPAYGFKGLRPRSGGLPLSTLELDVILQASYMLGKHFHRFPIFSFSNKIENNPTDL